MLRSKWIFRICLLTGLVFTIWLAIVASRRNEQRAECMPARSSGISLPGSPFWHMASPIISILEP